MRVESSYPTPIYGVSTLAPRSRFSGQAGLQENFRSDPVAKLTRRPSLEWDTQLVADTSGLEHIYHEYERGRDVIAFLLRQDGALITYRNGIEKTFFGSVATYAGQLSDMEFTSIDHVTYILNKAKIVEILPATDAAEVKKVVHVNVTAALNYNERITMRVIYNNGGAVKTIVHQVPDLGITDPDYDAADEQRATSRVAESLATQLNSFALDIVATHKGSTLSIRNTVTDEWVVVEVDEGQGSKSAIVINEVVSSIEGMPLYAVPGTVVTVKPDPEKDEGTYYLKAVRTSTGPALAAFTMEEVVWTEARAPLEPKGLDNSTMPHYVEYLPGTDDFEGGEVIWDERATGNDESCPRPFFVGKTIHTLGYFQKRLVTASENTISMTRTDKPHNWWKKSSISLLITDPIEIASSAVGINILEHIVPHNRDLLIIASNGQFKIDGTIGISPQTVSMPLTTSYDIETLIHPISLGNAVYYTVDYGTSTGLQEYTSKQNTSQDVANSITDHIVGYMQGKAKILVGSANLNMIAMTTDNTPANEVFVDEQFISGKQEQNAWNKWIFPEETEILSITFRNDRMNVICVEGTTIVEKHVAMYAKVALGASVNYLDDELEVDSSDGTRCTLPFQYNTSANTLVIRGEGADYAFLPIAFTVDGNDLVFAENISGGQACKVVVGRPFRSRYQPTRPFIRDKEGMAVTTNRVRIGKYILHVVDTDIVAMKILSDFVDIPDQIFSGRNLNNINNIIGELSLTTGDVKFSYSQDAALANAEFYTDSHLGCTIAGISWEGQYHQAAKRI